MIGVIGVITAVPSFTARFTVLPFADRAFAEHRRILRGTMVARGHHDRGRLRCCSGCCTSRCRS